MRALGFVFSAVWIAFVAYVVFFTVPHSITEPILPTDLLAKEVNPSGYPAPPDQNAIRQWPTIDADTLARLRSFASPPAIIAGIVSPNVLSDSPTGSIHTERSFDQRIQIAALFGFATSEEIQVKWRSIQQNLKNAKTAKQKEAIIIALIQMLPKYLDEREATIRTNAQEELSRAISTTTDQYNKSLAQIVADSKQVSATTVENAQKAIGTIVATANQELYSLDMMLKAGLILASLVGAAGIWLNSIMVLMKHRRENNVYVLEHDITQRDPGEAPAAANEPAANDQVPSRSSLGA
jgi:hypothetical protein